MTTPTWDGESPSQIEREIMGHKDQSAEITTNKYPTIYYGAHHPRLVGLRRSERVFIKNPDGTEGERMSRSAVRIEFNPFFILTEKSAEDHGCTYDEMKTLIEKYSKGGGHLVTITAEEHDKAMEEANAKKGVSLRRGPRSGV